MSTIIGKFNDAAEAAKAKMAAFGGAVADGAKQAGALVTNPDVQKQAEQVLRNGIDTAYTAIGNGLQSASDAMEGKAVELLRAPITSMSERKANLFEIDEDKDSSNKQSLKKLGNAVINYHTNVIVKGEAFSRAAGEKVHAGVRLFLMPVRIIFKALKMEVLGSLIQNSIALALAFAVRGIFLALTQIIGHVGPYAALGAALAALAKFVIIPTVIAYPIYSALTALGLIAIGQQFQISKLAGNVEEQTKTNKKLGAQLKDVATQMEYVEEKKEAEAAAKAKAETEVKAVATPSKTRTNLKRAVGAVAVISALAGAYFYGPRAVSYIGSTGAYQTVAGKVAGAYNTATPFVTGAYNRAAGYATSLYSRVAG